MLLVGYPCHLPCICTGSYLMDKQDNFCDPPITILKL